MDNADNIIFIEQNNNKNNYNKLLGQLRQLNDDNMTTLDLNDYNNNTIINALHSFIFYCDGINTKIDNIIVYVLKHIRDNSWNTIDFTKLQINIINNLFYYILKKNNFLTDEEQKTEIKNIDILLDFVFKEYQMTIIWNKNLYTYFLKLLTIIDFVECFEYIYNQAISNNHVIRLNILFDYKYINDDMPLDICGPIKCIKIIKYILTKIDNIIERNKFINLLYDNFLTKTRVSRLLEVCLDDVIGYFYINNRNYENNYLIYKYFKLNEIEHVKDKIIKCIILGKCKDKTIYDDCIKKFKINPNTYILDALKYKNFYYLTNIISIKTHDEIYDLLLNIASIPFSWIELYFDTRKMIKTFTHIRYINKLSQNQLETILLSAIKNKNEAIIQYLFNFFVKNYDTDVITLFKYVKYNKIIRLLVNLCNHHNVPLNFNNKNLLHVYMNNDVLLIYLLKNNMLNNNLLKILSDIVLNNNVIKKKYISYLIFENLNFPFDNKICKRLYELHHYGTVCMYLKKNHEQINLNYDMIKSQYIKIINCNSIQKLLFSLNLSTVQANDLMSNIKKERLAEKIMFLIRNIIGIKI